MIHFHLEAARIASDEVAAAGADEHERSDLEAGEAGLGIRATGTARIDSRSGISSRDAARFAVDTERLYFFDPDIGTAIRG
jgi:hypothetical protein